MSELTRKNLAAMADQALQDCDQLRDTNAELLAALEAGYSDLRTRLIQYAQSAFGASYEDAVKYTDTGVPVLAQMRAAIAKAKGESA
jgi:hypothetical protein